MEPKIKVGSVVFVRGVKPEILKEDDVITYASLEDPNISVTHRLTAIEEKEGKTVFKTRGDANNSGDIAEISPSQIKGKVIFSLPFLGYLSVWIRKPLGFGLLVILPALLIIVSEILNIKKTIEKEVEKKYAKHEKHKKSKPINLLFIFFLLGISLFQIKPTNAYFSDVVVVEGNTFSMGWWDGASVVVNEVYYDVLSAHTTADNEDKNEWIEIYNPTENIIDISGWKICDDHSCDTIPSSSSIPVHGYAVITPDASTWSYWPGIPDEAVKIVLGGHIGNGLDNQHDRVILRNSSGIEVDAVSWGTDTYAFTPSVMDVAEGHSISRVIKGVDTDTASDWMDTHAGSSPAGPNPGTNPHPPVELAELEETSQEIEETDLDEEMVIEDSQFVEEDLRESLVGEPGSETEAGGGVETEKVVVEEVGEVVETDLDEPLVSELSTELEETELITEQEKQVEESGGRLEDDDIIDEQEVVSDNSDEEPETEISNEQI